ncbi:MAG: hypothetical protein V4695_02000 [Pseudomonadota bacterium]
MIGIFLTAAFITCLPVLVQAMPLSFGVISHTAVAAPEDTVLREAIAATDADNLAFVVVNGIKASSEACSDQLFIRRKALLEKAKNGVIVSIAASDWSACRAENGQSLAIERLNRIRDLFFGSDFSFGSTKLPLVRQDRTPKFRTYAENLRWDIDRLVFATVNLPANNNDFTHAAGRNGEFEDRMIADRAWLQRLFASATHRNAVGIVLFVDGNPMAVVPPKSSNGASAYRDGFAEIRQHIQQLSQRFDGKIMLIHGQDTDNTAFANIITWQGNIGLLHLSSGWQKITADPTSPALFRVTPGLPLAKVIAP